MRVEKKQLTCRCLLFLSSVHIHFSAFPFLLLPFLPLRALAFAFLAHDVLQVLGASVDVLRVVGVLEGLWEVHI